MTKHATDSASYLTCQACRTNREDWGWEDEENQEDAIGVENWIAAGKS